MKITKTQLRQIIKEEIQNIFDKPQESNKIIQKINEAEGKGCARTQSCIRERDGGWVIMNNKKGGVWRKCKSKSHCEEILDAFHASRG
jgi:hypothetical protein